RGFAREERGDIVGEGRRGVVVIAGFLVRPLEPAFEPVARVRLPGDAPTRVPVRGRAVIVDGTGRDAGIVDRALAGSVDTAVAQDERGRDAVLEVSVRPQPEVAGPALERRVFTLGPARYVDLVAAPEEVRRHPQPVGLAPADAGIDVPVARAAGFKRERIDKRFQRPGARHRLPVDPRPLEPPAVA